MVLKSYLGRRIEAGGDLIGFVESMDRFALGIGEMQVEILARGHGHGRRQEDDRQLHLRSHQS